MVNQRIVFSTATPNDQGFRIPNNTISFSRYKKNPVILKQHDWGAPPLGLMTDIRQDAQGNWTGIPVFHGITQDSREYAQMWEQGFLKACSIGGYKELETTGRMIQDKEGNKYPEPKLDKDGIATCLSFELYEVSMVTIPANEDAVAAALAAVSYDAVKLNEIELSITTLSSKYINNMETNIQETEEEKALRLAKQAEEANKVALAAAGGAAKPSDGTKPPQVITDAIEHGKSQSKFGAIVDMFKMALGMLGGMTDGDKPAINATNGTAPTPEGKPESKPGIEGINHELPKKPGKLESLKNKISKAKLEAEGDIEEMKAAKECADKMDSSEEEKDKYAAAAAKVTEGIEKIQRLEAKLKAAEEDEDDEEDEDEDGKIKAKSKSTESAQLAAGGKTTTQAQKPTFSMKTTAQLQEEAKLAAAPSHRAKVLALSAGVTLSKLKADEKEGQRIYNRFRTSDAGDKQISDYAIVLNAMMNESKFAAVMDRTRFMANVNEARLGAYRSNPAIRTGISVKDLAAKLNSGSIDIMSSQNTMREITTLTATDNFLASPDLLAVEFLDLAIFKLFPATSWKNEIPLFAAQETGKNTGLIWANVKADPNISRGAKPVGQADYQYDDIAVALNLTPYWLQPMLWTPLTMHQLRYDQMSTGWAQAFAKWGAVMDDDLIYTLASTVPASAIIYSSGLSGQVPATPVQFNIGSANDPNGFYYNPAFRGALNVPTLNDIISMEQVYNKQDFELSSEVPYLVLDPTADALISKNTQTQSLLTRWVNSDGAELLKFKHTTFSNRSRVAIFDPTTGQVKDPRGVIPSTATSANLGFIPSQVGMGLGMLDVFMIQDPANYGYRMSADIRIGIVPLRANFYGTSLLVYGPSYPAIVS